MESWMEKLSGRKINVTVGQKCASFPPDQARLCFWGLILDGSRVWSRSGCCGLGWGVGWEAATRWPCGLSLPVPPCSCAGQGCASPQPHARQAQGAANRLKTAQGCWTFPRNRSLSGGSAWMEGNSSPHSWGHVWNMGDPGAFKAERSASLGSRPDSGRAELSRAPSMLCRGGGRCQQVVEVGPGFIGAWWQDSDGVYRRKGSDVQNHVFFSILDFLEIRRGEENGGEK